MKKTYKTKPGTNQHLVLNECQFVHLLTLAALKGVVKRTKYWTSLKSGLKLWNAFLFIEVGIVSVHNRG